MRGQVSFPSGRRSTWGGQRHGLQGQFLAPTYRSVSNFLARMLALAIFRLPNGAVAQLGERRTGSAEVWGSIPHSSTKVQVFLMGVTARVARVTPGE